MPLSKIKSKKKYMPNPYMPNPKTGGEKVFDGLVYGLVAPVYI